MSASKLPGSGSALSAPRGVTLVEMMVALVVTLIMMGAVITVFGLVGDSVSGSRATIEMAERVRGASQRLRFDLEGLTVETLPPTRPESASGYLVIIEGPGRDTSPAALDTALGLKDDAGNGDMGTVAGDYGDAILLTVRSRTEQFVGKFGGATIESPVAEIAWFTAKEPNDRYLSLYRRTLLVTPGVTMPAAANYAAFYENADVSARLSGTAFVGNTLADLTTRGNRFGQQGSEFTLPIISAFPATSPRYGEDVILTNVIGFDVKVWDPTAPLYDDTGTTLAPGDPGWAARHAAGGPISAGAYVDMNYGGSSRFGGPGVNNPPRVTLPLASATIPAVYDTWSFGYEMDGIDQDDGGAGAVDEGTDGIDNDNQNGPDDVGERETSPPYPAPLRGVQIKIRLYEPDSRQVREVTIVHNFLPE